MRQQMMIASRRLSSISRILQALYESVDGNYEALDRFSETGKPIVAIGDYFTQSQYLLASQADTIFLHPEGGVSLMGFGVYRTYLKQFLENIKVNFHIFERAKINRRWSPHARRHVTAGARSCR